MSQIAEADNYHYVPEHAKFPHKPHIRYGLECKTCHGDVEKSYL